MRRVSLAFGVAACTISGSLVAQNPEMLAAHSIHTARLGQTVRVDGPSVTPIALLEDSRCAPGVQCIWAGRVRVRVRIGLGAGRRTRYATKELTLLDSGVPAADGTLRLISVTPERKRDRALMPREYRFGFVFSGGL